MNFSQEVVQEFQIQSVTFDPSMGIAAGGGINIVTRSGSNDFHGSAYFFYRDDNMAAYPALGADSDRAESFFPAQESRRCCWAGRSSRTSCSSSSITNTSTRPRCCRAGGLAFGSRTSAESGRSHTTTICSTPVSIIRSTPRTRVPALLARRQPGLRPVRAHSAAGQFQFQLQLVGSGRAGPHQHALAEPGERCPLPVPLLGEQRH